MKDVLLIDELPQALALLKPARVDVLRRMAEETTCGAVARQLGQTPQWVNYHVRELERAGLVDRVSERRVRGTVEGIYRAKARAYWLSPRLVGKLGGERKARDRMSLGYLLTLAEEVHEDVGRLGRREGEVPSLGLSAQIELPDAGARSAFMRDVQSAFEALARKYGATGDAAGTGEVFKVALACYPDEREEP